LIKIVFDSTPQNRVGVSRCVQREFFYPSFQNDLWEGVSEVQVDGLSNLATIEVWKVAATMPPGFLEFLLKLDLDALHAAGSADVSSALSAQRED
jgi:hypothetical protein